MAINLARSAPLTGGGTVSGDLHIEGNITVDGTTTLDLDQVGVGNVGIGNTNPGSHLEVSASDEEPISEISCWSTTESHAPRLAFLKSGSATINQAVATEVNENLGEISFYGINNAGSPAIKKAAAIIVEQDAVKDDTAVSGRITFHTSDDDDDGTPTERMRIDDDGNVGIGEVAPDELLHLASSTDVKPYLKIEQTADNVNGGGIEFLTSSTATADDISGTLRFKGMNDAGTPAELEFATIYAKHTNITASGDAEAGELHFRARGASDSLDSRFVIDGNSRISLSNNLDLNTGNTVFGKSAWNIASTSTNNASDYNVVIGELAMGTGTIAGAAYNVAIGADALTDITSGVRNLAIGHQALAAITDANDNIMIGYQAGVAAEDAGFDYNIGIGNHVFDGVAADVDTIGNVAIGHGSMTGTLEDAADYNTCVGYQTGQIMTGGHSNVLLGAGAGTGISTGYQNILIGRDTAGTIDDDYNHVVIGHAAGTVLNSGNSCILIGRDTEPSTAAAENQIVFGANAIGQENHSVVLGDDYVTAVYMAEDSGATVHCGAVVHGLSAILVTTGTLAYATHSISKLKYVTVEADAQTLTLPAVQIGAVFIIVNIAADGTAGLTIDPDGNDKFLTDIAGGVGTDGNHIVNTQGTQNQGDFVKLVGMSADGWAITEIGGIWADE